MTMVVPDCGAIITQVTMMGLKEDADPQNMTLVRAVVVDTIGIERHNGTRIPGKIAGGSLLNLTVESPGAIAMCLTLACSPRTVSAQGDEAIDDTIEVESSE